MRFCDAVIIVGETVGESSASIIPAAAGSTFRAAASASSAGGVDPHTAARNASTSGMSCGSGANSASRSISAAALTSALSAIDGSDACPLRPCTRRTKGELIFSAAAQR